jgi:hypothetical protein
MTPNAVHHNDHRAVDPNLYSPRRRGAKALVCLLLAATVPLAADPPPRGTASPGEGAIVKQIFNWKLPNLGHRPLAGRGPARPRVRRW